jgi:hypothetical protein
MIVGLLVGLVTIADGVSSESLQASRSDAALSVAIRRVAGVFCKPEEWRQRCYLTVEGRRPEESLIRALRGVPGLVPAPVDGIPETAKPAWVIDAGRVRFVSTDRAEVGIAVMAGNALFETCIHRLALVDGEWQYSPKEPTCPVI